MSLLLCVLLAGNAIVLLMHNLAIRSVEERVEHLESLTKDSST